MIGAVGKHRLPVIFFSTVASFFPVIWDILPSAASPNTLGNGELAELDCGRL